MSSKLQKRIPFISSEGNLFNICVLYQCVVIEIKIKISYTFTYQKALLHTLFCLL